ncbi:hypothetical protein NLG97_g5768 [Lecanicillium saksenae]|uniref:Uncharacterized protein n=1 Tax=Lecanicillium saksenae TaxID=468837 RepID=A0ACC1QRJ3_9HYPO|nr:hypothetical protein NLG97_g5768 [Lecanicillium saksenae]
MAPFGGSLRWLRSKMMNEDERRREAIHTVPPLPPCPPSAVVSDPLPSATSRSAFFQRLPAEVRQRVLEAAFGDQTVHIHLALEWPLLRKHRHKNNVTRNQETYRDNGHDTALLGHGWHPGRYAWDPAAQPCWVWRSSSCHSGCFPHESWQCREPEWSGWSIDSDYCVSGEGCGLKEAPASCGVGAFGWLLACRRAYHEGLPVLYETNTLRVRGTYMFAHLPELLPPRILESLTTVSLCWDLGWLSDHPRRLALLARLPATFGGVRRLHLSLQGFLWPEDQGGAYGRRSRPVYERAEQLQCMILAHALRMPGLVDLRVALPRSLFLPWVQEVMDVTAEFVEPAWAEMPAVFVRRDAPPDMLSQGDEDKATMDSFLVLSGVSDLPVLTPMGCFGTK